MSHCRPCKNQASGWRTPVCMSLFWYPKNCAASLWRFISVRSLQSIPGESWLDETASKKITAWQWKTQPPTKNWLRIGGVSALIHPHVHFNLKFCCSPTVPPVRIISDKTGKFKWGLHANESIQAIHVGSRLRFGSNCRLFTSTYYLHGLCQRQELVKMPWNVGKERDLMYICVYI